MFPRKSRSASRCRSFSLGSKSAKTLSCVSSVSGELRSKPYLPFQRNVLPCFRSSPSSDTPRSRRNASSCAGKSSPITPTTETSVSRLAAAAKYVALPPSRFSRTPKGVSTESRATLPTTSTLMLGSNSSCRAGGELLHGEIGRLGMVHHQRGHAGLRVHHVAFRELDPDGLRPQQLEEQSLVLEVRAGGISERVALAAVP